MVAFVLCISFIFNGGGVNALYAQGNQELIPNVFVTLWETVGVDIISNSNACTPICNLPESGALTINQEAFVNSLANGNSMVEFVICPQFTLPATACGYAQLSPIDGCWHLWGGIQPAQGGYPVPVDLACLFDQSGIYHITARLWSDAAPPVGEPEQLTDGTESNTICVNVQNTADLQNFAISISPQAPYCVGTPITLSAPAYLADAATYIAWGITSPGAGSPDWYGCNTPTECLTYTLLPTQAGEYTVNLEVGYDDAGGCPEYANQIFTLTTTNDPCVCIAPQEFLVNPDSPNIQNNILTDFRPAYIAESGTWTATNNPFVTNYGLPAGNDLYINVDLIIPAGVQLTINSMNIHFAPNSRILVQRGAILRLAGPINPTNLYGSCGSMWQGIQVEGAQNIRLFSGGTNFPDNYGILEARHVRIYDAIFGATNTKLPLMDVNTIATQITLLSANPIVPSGTAFTPSMVTALLYNGIITAPLAFEYSGGYLSIGSTYFINCLEGVLMPWYKGGCNVAAPYPCEGAIVNCVFTSTGTLAYPFNAPNLLPRTEAGIHIISYTPAQSERLNIAFNEFHNLNYGIRIAGSERTDIQTNQFSDCAVGISILNYSYSSLYMIQDINITHNQLNNCNINMQLSRTQARIVQNAINNTYVPPSGGLTDANNIGIFIQGANAQVFNNTINFVQAGVILLSNDTDPMWVSNNNFNANVVGVFAYGNNRTVQVTCNDFDNYAVALYALNYTASSFLYPSEEGMLSAQGNCNETFPSPADNLFGQFLGTLGWHIVAAPYPAANNFIYWYRNQPGFIPTITVGEVSPLPCFPVTGLPPREFLCGVIGSEMIREDEEIRNLADEGLKNYEAMKKVYYYVYDQNDTIAAQGLLQDIQTYYGNRLLLNYYLIKGNYAAANNTLSNLPDTREEEQLFIQLYQLYTDWRQSGRNIFQITPAEETILRQIAATTTQTATEARTLLYLLRGEEYPIDLPPIADLIDPSLFQNVFINFKGSATTTTQLTQIGNPYPNPANNGFSIDYTLAKDVSAQLTIYNHAGKVQGTYTLSGSGVFSIATAEWINGMYYYRVTAENETPISGKIVILK